MVAGKPELDLGCPIGFFLRATVLGVRLDGEVETMSEVLMSVVKYK